MNMNDDIFDMEGEEAILDGTVQRTASGVARQIPRLDERVGDLVVVRESAVYDHILMEGCIQHTLSYCKVVPGYETARAIGLDPLLSPSAVPAHVMMIPLSHRKTKAVLWSADGTAFLYSEASAASTDEKGDNHWTVILNTVLERLRPEKLHVVALSRLVRSFSQTGLVQHAVASYVDEVIAGGTHIVMKEGGDGSGHLLWATLTTISASERNLIVQRLTAGVVAKFRRGQWVRGRGSQPLGYVFDPDTKNLRLDDSQHANVALAWTLLADPSVTAEKFVRILADEGVTTPNMLLRGADKTVGDMSDPQSYINHLFRFADLYRTGRHVQRLKNPFPGAEHISTLPVLPASTKEYPHGYLEFEYDWGVTKGGWVDDEVIAAALEIRQRKRERQGGRSHRRVAPLTGLQWTQGGLHYLLQGRDAEHYELRVRAGAES